MEYEELVRLLKKRDNIERIILDNLPNNTDECNCLLDLDKNEEVPEAIDVIHYGNLFTEVYRFCLKCGGIRDILDGE